MPKQKQAAQGSSVQKKRPTLFEVFFLFFVVGISFALKVWLTQQYHILFWFDQARDSIVSQEMVTTHHWKVQGPSASGTQDTIYHGVVWFYFLAPLYAVFHGDPQGVVWAIALLTSMAILPYYFFTKEFSGSKSVAGIAALLIAFSPDSITNSTWIANPVLAYCLLPVFYLSLWKTFFERRYRWILLVAVTLGLLQQSIIFLSYLWIAVFLSYAFDWNKQKKNCLPLPLLGVSFVIYFLSISTMVITQLKLVAAGIYPTLSTAHVDIIEKNSVTLIESFFNLYFEKMRWVVLPQLPVLSVMIVIIACVVTWKNISQPKKYFLAMWLLAPLSLLLFHYRDAIHIILGTEWVFIFCCAFAVEKFCPKNATRLALYALFLMLFFGQFFAIKTLRKNEESFVGTQQGAWMDQQLAVIDKTYALAVGQPFSISSYTNPYGYNTTWSYLYHWYGLKTYGYLPKFYGPDQSGLFGDGLLVKSAKPLPIHFTIVEPITGVPTIIRDTFMNEQDAASATPSATYHFGSVDVQERVVKSISK
jgi:hypothetical protein